MLLNRLHVGAYGLLLKDKQILLAQKTRGPYTGLWDLPGGKIEHGETPEAALAREITEETGIIAQQWQWLANFSRLINFTDQRGDISLHHLGLIYWITKYNDSHLCQDLAYEDVECCAWHSIKTMQQWTPFAIEAWEVWKRQTDESRR